MSNLRSWALALFLVLAPKLAAQDKYFNSDGVTIRYVVERTGEPIVLVHGLEGSLENWVKRGILPDLARNDQVIAFDLRGHGKSWKPHDPKAYGREMALDIVRLLDHLGIARAHVVGFSLWRSQCSPAPSGSATPLSRARPAFASRPRSAISWLSSWSSQRARLFEMAWGRAGTGDWFAAVFFGSSAAVAWWVALGSPSGECRGAIDGLFLASGDGFCRVGFGIVAGISTALAILFVRRLFRPKADES